MNNAARSLLKPARWRVWEPVLWLIAFVMPLLLPTHALLISEIAIVALFAVSLDLILGYSGIVSLGHAAFFGIGAYAAALFAKLVMPDPLVPFGTNVNGYEMQMPDGLTVMMAPANPPGLPPQ